MPRIAARMAATRNLTGVVIEGNLVVGRRATPLRHALDAVEDARGRPGRASPWGRAPARRPARGRCRVRVSCGCPSDRGRARIRIECGAHRAVGMVESGAGGAGRDRRGSRRSRSVPGPRSGEARGGRAAPVAVAGSRAPAGPGRRRSGSRPSIDGSSSGSAWRLPMRRRVADRLGEAGSHHQAVEPGVEAVRVAEAGQVTPGDHQRVLHGILGPVDVAEDPLRDRVEPVATRADQVGVCLPVPASCGLHEITIHRVAPRGRPAGAPSDTMGVATLPAFNLHPGGFAHVARRR